MKKFTTHHSTIHHSLCHELAQKLEFEFQSWNLRCLCSLAQWQCKQSVWRINVLNGSSMSICQVAWILNLSVQCLLNQHVDFIVVHDVIVADVIVAERIVSWQERRRTARLMDVNHLRLLVRCRNSGRFHSVGHDLLMLIAVAVIPKSQIASLQFCRHERIELQGRTKTRSSFILVLNLQESFRVTKVLLMN